MTHELTVLELDRIHAALFADEEKLNQDYDGSITVGIDAQEIEDLVDSDPEVAWEIFEAFYCQESGDYEYSDKYLGEYKEASDGTFTFTPYA